jgi:hypothetical protein
MTGALDHGVHDALDAAVQHKLEQARVCWLRPAAALFGCSCCSTRGSVSGGKPITLTVE